MVVAKTTPADKKIEEEIIKDENITRKSSGLQELDFFEQAGINIKGLKNKWVRMNVGKMKIEGKVIQVNLQYALLKIKGRDNYVTIVRLSKVNAISILEI